jgi:FlaA1/EpsC-like NDP-sugar epimerase
MLKDKKILITGACGTVGSALMEMLLTNPIYSPNEVIGVDNNESALFFADQKYINEPRTKLFLTDVRDRDRLVRLMESIDIVFHAAALKHVELCEHSPFEAVQTNIHGVQNIILAASENKVEKVIFTSSDKAVNPTNVMGTSKLMGERLITAANSNHRQNCIFYSTRFGNVLGSSGSVIPLFKKQIAKGGPVTLTDPEMTRFVMTIEDSAQMVINSIGLARGGEVFITKMPTIRIKDLAQVMINVLAPQFGYSPEDIAIKIIGKKLGEKLYEELMSIEETYRAVEMERYFVVTPAFRNLYQEIEYNYSKVVSKIVTNPYISSKETPLNLKSLSTYLCDCKLLELSDEEKYSHNL